MKLSDELQQINDSGDVGEYVEGFAERARMLEDACKAALEQIEQLVKDKVIMSGTIAENRIRKALEQK